MKNIIDLFTRNWALKLLALILSLVIFYVVRDSITKAHANPQNFGGTIDTRIR